MDKIVIEGGRPLEGVVNISGAKNAVLPILAATLLTRGRNIIEGVPKVRDVITMIQLLKSLGAEVESDSNEKIIFNIGYLYIGWNCCTCRYHSYNDILFTINHECSCNTG